MKILVIQPWGIGDLILTVPLLVAIREKHHNCHIAVMTRKNPANQLLLQKQVIDSCFETKKSIASVMRAFLKIRNVDEVYICNGVSSLYFYASRILLRSGRIRYRKEFEFHRAVDYLRLTCNQDGLDKARKYYKKVFVPLKPESGALVIHPGNAATSAADKGIPISQLNEIIHSCERSGISVKILLGPDDEHLEKQIEANSSDTQILSKLSLVNVAETIRRAALFLGTDSALSHIAGAYNKDAILFLGPTRPDLTRPLSQNISMVKTELKLDCQPCWGTRSWGNCQRQNVCTTSIDSARIGELIKLKMLENYHSNVNLEVRVSEDQNSRSSDVLTCAQSCPG